MPKLVAFTEKQEREIADHYENQQLTVAEIARMFDCSATPIQRVLRDQGVDMRSQGDELRLNRNQKIIALNDKGHSLEQIAKTVGVTRQRVHQIVSRGY